MRFSYVLFCPSETPDPEDSQYHHIRLINIFLTHGKFCTCKYLPLIMLLLIGRLPVITRLLYWSLGQKTFMEGTIYKYRAKTLNGSQTVNFSDYAGKAVLFVNVATY
uniref:Uncharacterized protein n=1 Tax=Oreochromis niloticus TaxID=8128 RepID=A0A669DQF9_ORENI